MWFHYKGARAVVFWRTVFRPLELALLSKDLETSGRRGWPITNARDGWEENKSKQTKKPSSFASGSEDGRAAGSGYSHPEELCLAVTPLWSCLSTPPWFSPRSTSAVTPYAQIPAPGEHPLPLLLRRPQQGLRLRRGSGSCQPTSTCLTSAGTLKCPTWRLGYYSEEWGCEIWDGRTWMSQIKPNNLEPPKHLGPPLPFQSKRSISATGLARVTPSSPAARRWEATGPTGRMVCCRLMEADVLLSRMWYMFEPETNVRCCVPRCQYRQAGN